MSQVLIEWLGEGGAPVAPVVARYRADICRVCPKNVAPNWWQKNLLDPIAGVIRAGLEIKNSLNLSVEREDELHMCRVCGCCARLKVWTPIQHILKNTDPKKLQEFDKDCWIIQNLK
jgi:hypothetical protein